MKRISYKIFLFLNCLTYGFVLLYLLMNYLFLEDYQIAQKQKQMIGIALNYNSESLQEMKQEWEERGIFIKEFDPRISPSFYSNRKDKAHLIKLDEDVVQKLSQKNEILEIYTGRDYATRILLAKKLPDSNILIITSAVRPIKEFLRASFQFFLYIVFGSIPINLYIAYILSVKMGRPIESELMALNAQLKEELEKEKKLDAFRKGFIANITHELKTPVAIISGYSDAIIDGIIPENEITDVCKNINTEASNMDSLIKELLFYSKMESGYIPVNKEELNLKELILSLISRYSLDLKSKDFKLDLSLEDSYIYTDRKLLERCLNNIFINALAYVDSRKEISVILKQDMLIIKNSSEKITNKDIEEYFLPFSKKDDKKSRKYGGTGLGLSIVSEILKYLTLTYEFKYDDDKKEALFLIKF